MHAQCCPMPGLPRACTLPLQLRLLCRRRLRRGRCNLARLLQLLGHRLGARVELCAQRRNRLVSLLLGITLCGGQLVVEGKEIGKVSW